MEASEPDRTMKCEILWAPEQARQVQQIIEEATGEPCPCKQGKECPIAPKSLRVVQPVEVRAPIVLWRHPRASA